MSKNSEKPLIRTASFVTSSPGVDACPSDKLPEYAFIGRSNVGKSSLINMLTETKGLAKTSQTPGKTRLINHFIINEQWYLVDLPGYGYARISKKERVRWEKMIHDYLLKRKTLVCTFILIDTRLEPQKSDTAFMEWMASAQLPFIILFTKTDKISRTRLDAAIAAYCRHLMEHWEELPEYIATSAMTGLGKERLLQLIAANNALYEEYMKGKG